MPAGGGEERLQPGARVLACRVLEPELSAMGLAAEAVCYQEQQLHRAPERLTRTLADGLAGIEADPDAGLVILGYGLCGGGLQGLRSRRVRLRAPLVHDCIPLLLGRTPPPGGDVFYLSRGWIDHGQTPYSEYFVTAERFGAEDALWTARQMLKGYRKIALIRTPAGLEERHRRYARDMAALFELECEEVPGSHRLLGELLAGRGEGFMELGPGEPLATASYPQAQA